VLWPVSDRATAVAVEVSMIRGGICRKQRDGRPSVVMVRGRKARAQQESACGVGRPAHNTAVDADSVFLKHTYCSGQFCFLCG
jgi:hypothetical protein